MRPIDGRYWMIHSVPNGAYLDAKIINGKRVCPEAKKLKAEGLLPGVLDVMIDYPITGKIYGARIEFKSYKGVISPEQKQRLKALEYLGCATLVARTVEEAKHFTEHFFKLDENPGRRHILADFFPDILVKSRADRRS